MSSCSFGYFQMKIFFNVIASCFNLYSSLDYYEYSQKQIYKLIALIKELRLAFTQWTNESNQNKNMHETTRVINSWIDEAST